MSVPEKTTVKFKVGRLMKKKIQKDQDAEGEATATPASAAGGEGGESDIHQEALNS